MLMGKQLTQSLMFEAVFRITTWSSRPRAGLYRVLIQSATSFQGPHIQTGFSAGYVVKADRNLGATRSHAVLNYSCRMQASMVCNVGPPSNAENMTAKRWSKPLWV